MCRLEGENIELEAIRALQYEGSRAEVALGFKERGNEMVKAKMWKDGRDLYTQALGVLHKASKYPKSDEKAGASDDELGLETEAESDIQQEKSVEEACYVNRALCNLELSKTSFSTWYRRKQEFTSPRISVFSNQTAP